MVYKKLLSAITLLVIATLALPSSSAASRAAAPRSPARQTTTASAPGFYLVGSKNLDPALFHNAGDMQFYSWAALEPSQGQYNWGTLDYYLETHSASGKRVGIAITTYDGRGGTGVLQMPQWVRDLPNTTISGQLTEAVRNGGLDNSSLSSWSRSGPVSASSTIRHSGSYAAKLGGTTNSTADLIQYSVRIPAALAYGQISYWWYMETSESGGSAKDTLTVELLEGSSRVVLVQSISNTAAQGVWTRHTLDLTPYGGRYATLRFRVTNDGSNPTTFYIDDVSVSVQPLVPKYWDPAYLTPYQAFVQALGERYRDDPRLEFVAIGTGSFGETRATDLVDRPATQAAGLDSALWVQTVNTITDFYVNAFSENGELKKVLLLQQAPFQYERWERREFSDYAAAAGVGLSFNGLYWDWNFAEADMHPDPLQRGTGAYDPLNLYWPQVPVAFETYPTLLGGNNADRFYWGILNALDKHASYIRMSKYSGWYLDAGDQPVTEFTDVMAWAAPYLGATLDPNDPHYTPSVWVALREHIDPVYYHYANLYETSSYPPLGNFEFWLYQRDDVSGGRTVPETNISSLNGQTPQMGLCPPGTGGPPGYPCHANAYNPALPQTREAMTIRRTDQASGNPFMFFDIDDGYIYDGTNEVRITITYWDHGTDRFRLQYDSVSGPRYAQPEGSSGTWVQKQNSGQFRTVTFHLTDARFANGLSGSTDFAIDSRDQNEANDGDEWIHFVDVVKLSSSPPPPPCHDFNSNGEVDAGDLLAIASLWGYIAGPPYDLDSDGRVTIVDIMQVAATWGNRCS